MKSLQQQISEISNFINNCNSTLQNGSTTQIKDLYDRLYSKSCTQTDYLIPKEIHRLSLWCGEAFYTDSN